MCCQNSLEADFRPRKKKKIQLSTDYFLFSKKHDASLIETRHFDDMTEYFFCNNKILK